MDSNNPLPGIEHVSTPTTAKTIKELIFEELDTGNIGLWFSLPPVEIYPGLWLGNLFNAQDLHFRAHRNIQTIINCATYEAQPQLINIQTYMCLNCSDDIHYKILDNHFSYVYEMIDMSLEKGSNVLIHCQCGINRSVTLAIAYICMKTRCSIEKAIIDVFRVRPCILSNKGFRNQLFDWAAEQHWINYPYVQSVSLVEIQSEEEDEKPKAYKLITSTSE